MSNDIRYYDDLMKKVLKITKRCIRDLREELQRENPPMTIALTAHQTNISLLILGMIDDCDRIMKGGFDDKLETVLSLIGKSIKQFRKENELKEGEHDINQTTH